MHEFVVYFNLLTTEMSLSLMLSILGEGNYSCPLGMDWWKMSMIFFGFNVVLCSFSALLLLKLRAPDYLVGRSDFGELRPTTRRSALRQIFIKRRSCYPHPKNALIQWSKQRKRAARAPQCSWRRYTKPEGVDQPFWIVRGGCWASPRPRRDQNSFELPWPEGKGRYWDFDFVGLGPERGPTKKSLYSTSTLHFRKPPHNQYCQSILFTKGKYAS